MIKLIYGTNIISIYCFMDYGNFKVVLPEPLGPIKPTIDPCSTATEISTLACTPPKDLLTLLTSKILILFLPVLFDLFHQLLHQIYQGIFLLTNPLVPLGNKLRSQQLKLQAQHIANPK